MMGPQLLLMLPNENAVQRGARRRLRASELPAKVDTTKIRHIPKKQMAGP
jgi:hypothetical protein